MQKDPKLVKDGMKRLLVTYDDVFMLEDVLILIAQVIKQGRISKNASFCSVTTFGASSETIVYAERTPNGSDSFKIRKDTPNNTIKT